MGDYNIYKEVLSLVERYSKPVLNEQEVKYKKFPAFLDLKLDASFLGREEDIEDKDYNQIVSVAKSLGIDKSADFGTGISRLIDMGSRLQSESIQNKSPADLMNRVRMMRVIYNLVDNASPSSAGFLFERLFAILFGMKVETSTVDNIKDVVSSSGEGVSLKLIGPKTTITGSKKLLASAGGSVDYIVARKSEDKNELSFYNIKVSLEEESAEGQFSLSYYKAASKGEEVSKDGVTLRAELIGTLDISNVVPVSEQIADMVNKKFNSLIEETDQLIDAVRDLVGAEKETKTKAAKAEKKAEKAKSAAQKIQQN